MIMAAKDKCNNSGLVLLSFGDSVKRFKNCEDGSGRKICPCCGRPVKLRKHPSSAAYLLVPHHNKYGV